MQATERLLLSSAYFNITGGRRQDSADTFRVLASMQTHSGQEAALYAVSEASAPGPMGSRARRMVIDVIQGAYASQFELGPAARLRGAVLAAHEQLRVEFERHVKVGLTALVAEGTSLYLLQVPPAQAFVLHDASLHSVSAASRMPDKPFAQAMGGDEEPAISLFRDTMEPDDVVLLCSSWFAGRLPAEELRSVFSDDGPDAIVQNLFQRARDLDARDVTAIALQAVPDETVEEEQPNGHVTEDSPTLWAQVDEAASSLAYVWRRALEELKPSPTTVARSRRSRVDIDETVEPQAQSAAGQSAEPGESQELPTDVDLSAGEPISPVEQFGEPEWTVTETAVEHGTEEIPILPQGSLPNEPDLSAPPAPAPSSAASRQAEMDEVNSFIQNTMNLGAVTPPVHGFQDTSVAPERIYTPAGPPRAGRMAQMRDGLRWRGGEGRGAVKARIGQAGWTRRAAGMRAGRAMGLSRIPAAMWLWSAVGLVLLVVIIVAVSAAGGLGSGKAAPDFSTKARAHATAALHGTGRQYQRRQLALAWHDIVLARRKGEPARVVAAAARFVQAQADSIHHVIRFANPTFVAGFGHLHNAHPAQLGVGTSAIYVLDNHRQDLFYVDPSTHRLSVEAHPGVSLSGYFWHDPTQLTVEGNTMVAIDTEYHALTFTPGGAQPTVEQLVPPSNSANIVATTTFGTNLYLLDSAAGQIWRYYGAAAGGFQNYAGGYIGAPNPAQLHRAVGLAIDGDVYVALRGGTILKYVAGHQVPFPTHPEVPLFHISQVYTRSDLRYVFVVDGPRGHILEFGKQGQYVRTFAVPVGPRMQMRQMAVSADGRSILFIRGHGIYRISIPG